MKYEVTPTSKFRNNLKNYFKKDKKLAHKISTSIKKISEYPFDLSLRTHKVQTSLFGMVYSSRVSADIRILWDFEDGCINIITLLSIGGHSGKRGVYK